MSEARNRATLEALATAINGRDLGAGDPYQCVFIFQMRDGLIDKEIAYWSKPFLAPEWRAPWVERM
jgi:hypothetical protein